MVYGAPALYSYDSKLLRHKFLQTSYGAVTISEPQPPEQGKLDLDRPSASM